MSEEKPEQTPQPEQPKVDVAALEQRAKNFEAKYVDLQKKLESFSGIDPEAHRAMKEDYDNLRRQQAQGDPDAIDRLVSEKQAELESAYKSHLEEARTKASTLEKELKQLRVTDKLLDGDAALIFCSLIACEAGVRIHLYRKYGRHYKYALFCYFLGDHKKYGNTLRPGLSARKTPFIVLTPNILNCLYIIVLWQKNT